MLALEAANDNGHLFAQTDPKHNPVDTAGRFNSGSGKCLLERHPESQEQSFWSGGVWEIGYSVGATGPVSENAVERDVKGIAHAPERRASLHPQWSGELALAFI